MMAVDENCVNVHDGGSCGGGGARLPALRKSLTQATEKY